METKATLSNQTSLSTKVIISITWWSRSHTARPSTRATRACATTPNHTEWSPHNSRMRTKVTIPIARAAKCLTCSKSTTILTRLKRSCPAELRSPYSWRPSARNRRSNASANSEETSTTPSKWLSRRRTSRRSRIRTATTSTASNSRNSRVCSSTKSPPSKPRQICRVKVAAPCGRARLRRKMPTRAVTFARHSKPMLCSSNTSTGRKSRRSSKCRASQRSPVHRNYKS